MATISYQNKRSSYEFTVAGNDNEMLGNGAIPEQLADLAGRSAIYTQPDQTNLSYQQFSLKADNYISDQQSWQANAYYRSNEIDSINGDDSDYEECSFGFKREPV